ncbi:Uridine-cytidine kinase-like 1 [Podila verticillata]|nr:Uridine-cytidine kinase-like 1 [Podila verticillata]KAF9390996.1 Uridine-cytidine kinase-like 1 [Podila verticillata]KFH73709.1 uridine kinase [Podila verticillata NRRL 6337]
MKDNKLANHVIAAEGRPPWYRSDGQNCDCYIVGIAGGSASGKTSVAQRIIKNLNVPWVVLLSMDSFYKDLTPEEVEIAHRNDWDFDSPNSYDYDLLLETITKLKQGRTVDVPIYDFETHKRVPNKHTTVYGANVIIFEGIFGLYDKKVLEMMDLKVFVDTDTDICLARRIKRDVAERGFDVAGVLTLYQRFVKPSYDNYVYPTKRNADVVIPRGLENLVAIDLLTKHIQRQLQERKMQSRWDMARISAPEELPSNVIVLEKTKQLLGMHTIIRDINTSRHDFIFYADRLATLVIERALEELPYEPRTVQTPTSQTVHGLGQKVNVGGVSILRAGGTMEIGLRRVIRDAVIGKILIQTNSLNGEPQLHYCKLPPSLRDNNTYIFLMDAVVGTGAAGLMAIRVLLDHDVPEDRIIFLSFLAGPQGLHTIAKAFPRVKIVTSYIDSVLNAQTLFLEPGLGNFGDRYFGTENE